jgi:hypothetical protein
MSGTTSVPLAFRISSARCVVGPLAPSTMILALMLGAFLARIWFSFAAGIRMSHSSSSRSVLETFSTPAKPSKVRPFS